MDDALVEAVARGRDIALMQDAMRFFVWAAGEGLSAADGEAPEPETTLYEYILATGDEDLDGLPDRLAANVARAALAVAVPLIVAAERERWMLEQPIKVGARLMKAMSKGTDQFIAESKRIEDEVRERDNRRAAIRQGPSEGESQ